MSRGGKNVFTCFYRAAKEEHETLVERDIPLSASSTQCYNLLMKMRNLVLVILLVLCIIGILVVLRQNTAGRQGCLNNGPTKECIMAK